MWIFKGKDCETSPEGAYGFVYLITYIGEELDGIKPGTIYVGKKSFTHKSKKVLSKKAKLLPENKGKRIARGTKDSGWKDYFGSSLDLKAFVEKVGKEKFTREILEFTKNKTQSSYLEVVKQIEFKVLEVESFNKWISCKIYRSQLKK